jgi:hypothetical protein
MSLGSYEEQYKRSLEESRRGIAQQVDLALQDVAQREASGKSSVNELNPQLTTIYKQGQGNIAANTKHLDQAQRASGLQSFMSADAMLQPLQAAVTADKTARLADVPLLGQAVTIEADRQRNGLQQARLAYEQQVEAEQRAHFEQLAAAEHAAQLQAAAIRSSARGPDYAREDAVREDEQNFQREMAMLGMSKDDRDEATGLGRAEVAKLRRGDQYKRALEMMKDTYKKSGGVLGMFQKTSGHKPATAEELYKAFRTQPRMLKVLAADFPHFAKYIATGDF